MTLVGRNGERRVSGGGNRGRVHIRALVQQDAPHLRVSAAGRLHQRREARLGAVFNVRLAVQQQGHYFVTTLQRKNDWIKKIPVMDKD